MHTLRRNSTLLLLWALAAAVVLALPPVASADPVAAGVARGYGATVELGGESVIPPLPEATAEAPPDADTEEVVIGIPADPLLINGTLIARANAHSAADIASALEVESQETDGPYNARGLGQIEDLQLLIADDMALLEADVVRAEAVAVCDGGQVRYSATSEIVNLAIGGQQVPLNGPVQDLVDAVNAVLEQTTLNQVANITRNVVTQLPDGGITVDALVVTLLEAAGDEPLARVVLGHAEAAGVSCAGAPGPLPDGDIVQVRKTPTAAVVAPGQHFDYQITVTNTSPDCTLEDVRVVDTVTGPPGSLITATDPAADSVDALAVTWNEVGPLAPRESASLVLTVAVPADAASGAVYRDEVAVSADCAGEVVDTEDAVDGPTVAVPGAGGCNIATSVKDASHSEVPPGGEFTYNILALNSGGETCENIAVTDTLDDRLILVGCVPSCSSGGQQVRFTVATLAPGASRVLSIHVRVRDDATGTLGNTALIDPANGDQTTVAIEGPVITDRFVPAPVRLPGPAPAPGPLPATGSTAPAGLAILFALTGALGVAALRRTQPSGR